MHITAMTGNTQRGPRTTPAKEEHEVKPGSEEIQDSSSHPENQVHNHPKGYRRKKLLKGIGHSEKVITMVDSVSKLLNTVDSADGTPPVSSTSMKFLNAGLKIFKFSAGCTVQSKSTAADDFTGAVNGLTDFIQCLKKEKANELAKEQQGEIPDEGKDEESDEEIDVGKPEDPDTEEDGESDEEIDVGEQEDAYTEEDGGSDEAKEEESGEESEE